MVAASGGSGISSVVNREITTSVETARNFSLPENIPDVSPRRVRERSTLAFTRSYVSFQNEIGERLNRCEALLFGRILKEGQDRWEGWIRIDRLQGDWSARMYRHAMQSIRKLGLVTSYQRGHDDQKRPALRLTVVQPEGYGEARARIEARFLQRGRPGRPKGATVKKPRATSTDQISVPRAPSSGVFSSEALDSETLWLNFDGVEDQGQSEREHADRCAEEVPAQDIDDGERAESERADDVCPAEGERAEGERAEGECADEGRGDGDERTNEIEVERAMAVWNGELEETLGMYGYSAKEEAGPHLEEETGNDDPDDDDRVWEGFDEDEDLPQDPDYRGMDCAVSDAPEIPEAPDFLEMKVDLEARSTEEIASDSGVSLPPQPEPPQGSDDLPMVALFALTELRRAGREEKMTVEACMERIRPLMAWGSSDAVQAYLAAAIEKKLKDPHVTYPLGAACKDRGARGAIQALEFERSQAMKQVWHAEQARQTPPAFSDTQAPVGPSSQAVPGQAKAGVSIPETNDIDGHVARLMLIVAKECPGLHPRQATVYLHKILAWGTLEACEIYLRDKLPGFANPNRKPKIDSPLVVCCLEHNAKSVIEGIDRRSSVREAARLRVQGGSTMAPPSALPRASSLDNSISVAFVPATAPVFQPVNVDHMPEGVFFLPKGAFPTTRETLRIQQFKGWNYRYDSKSERWERRGRMVASDEVRPNPFTKAPQFPVPARHVLGQAQVTIDVPGVSAVSTLVDRYSDPPQRPNLRLVPALGAAPRSNDGDPSDRLAALAPPLSPLRLAQGPRATTRGPCPLGPRTLRSGSACHPPRWRPRRLWRGT